MKKRMLLIDDDQELCEELQDIFKDEGFSVTIVYDGISGKKLLETEIFDILLLDIKIPGINGFKILKWLKDCNITIKIIVLTGRPLNKAIQTNEFNSEEEELLKYAGAVLNKPSKIEIIIEEIHRLL